MRTIIGRIIAACRPFVRAVPLLFPAVSLTAIQPEKKEAVVYRLQSFAASEYTTVYSPPQAEEIYLIADSDNAFDPRVTLVFYWPLSKEYFESWEALDVEVKGSLEITGPGAAVRRIQRVPVAFSSTDSQDVSALLSDRDAEKSYAAFQKLDQEYKRRMASYGEAILQYRREMRRYMRETSRTDSDALPPKEPPEPEAPRGYVTSPSSQFLVRLPEGRYSARMVDERGDVIEGSERTLVSFKPVVNAGIGYQIMPEERWTARAQADAPEDGLYCAPGKELYVIPYRTQVFRQEQFLRLKNPQNKDAPRGTLSVYIEPLDAERLILSARGKPPFLVERAPYYVKQATGAELGYSIVAWSREAAGSDGPTFAAFRLKFDDEGSTHGMGVEDPGGGGILSGSGRTLRVVAENGLAPAWLISFAPLAAGAFVFVWRRKKA